MKTSICALLLIMSINTYAQEKIVVVKNGNESFIEAYNMLYLEKAYRLGPSASSKLKQGLRTALNWIDLNNLHKKSFEKEICRFKAMDKEQYKFHGYVDEFTTEIILLFVGKSDGSFEMILKPYNSTYTTFIKLTSKDSVKKFNDLLDGKSVNDEIDDIFKL